jgi:hypothetical protein
MIEGGVGGTTVVAVDEGDGEEDMMEDGEGTTEDAEGGEVAVAALVVAVGTSEVSSGVSLNPLCCWTHGLHSSIPTRDGWQRCDRPKMPVLI